MAYTVADIHDWEKAMEGVARSLNMYVYEAPESLIRTPSYSIVTQCYRLRLG